MERENPVLNLIDTKLGAVSLNAIAGFVQSDEIPFDGSLPNYEAAIIRFENSF